MPESTIPRSWDGFIRIPGGIDCAICGKTLGSIDDPHSNPAESYTGTYTGLCYNCERSTIWACYRCDDGLIYYSHPPHLPSWRRDREFYVAYEDCTACRSGAVRVSRSDAMGGSYNTQCKECQNKCDSHPERSAYLAERNRLYEQTGQIMSRLEKEYAKKIKKLDDAGKEELKTRLQAEFETWRSAHPAPARPIGLYWNYELKRERLFMAHQGIGQAGGDEIIINPDRRFYVSVIDGPRYGFLIGPFKLHQTALSIVDSVSRLTQERYPWSHFYQFGTCSLPKESAFKITGRLNDDPEFREIYQTAFLSENRGLVETAGPTSRKGR